MSVHLLSSDSEEFKVDKEVAERSVLIKNMLEGRRQKKRTKQINNEHSRKKETKKNTYLFFICRYWRF